MAEETDQHAAGAVESCDHDWLLVEAVISAMGADTVQQCSRCEATSFRAAAGNRPRPALPPLLYTRTERP